MSVDTGSIRPRTYPDLTITVIDERYEQDDYFFTDLVEECDSGDEGEGGEIGHIDTHIDTHIDARIVRAEDIEEDLTIQEEPDVVANTENDANDENCEPSDEIPYSSSTDELEIRTVSTAFSDTDTDEYTDEYTNEYDSDRAHTNETHNTARDEPSSEFRLNFVRLADEFNTCVHGLELTKRKMHVRYNRMYKTRMSANLYPQYALVNRLRLRVNEIMLEIERAIPMVRRCVDLSRVYLNVMRLYHIVRQNSITKPLDFD